MKHTKFFSATCVALWLAGCTGQIATNGGAPAGQNNGNGNGSNTGNGNGSSTGGGSNGGGNGTDPGGGGTNPSAGCMPKGAGVSVLHARMLSPRQYDSSSVAVGDGTGAPAPDFGGGADAQLDDLGAERRANAAASIAHQAATTLSTWAPCAPPMVEAGACEQQLIDHVGLHAFRHPLAPAEKAQLQTLFDAGMKEKDFATGVEWMLTGVLQSPDFLYQFAKPAAQESAGAVRPIVGYEMASRLAYFVWDSMPDDKLFAAAEKGLADRDAVAAEITRMLADGPRFIRGVTSFYSTWLELDGFSELARDDKGFTSDLVNSLGNSLLMNATKFYADAAPNISTLFSGQSYYLDSKLRAFYGQAAGGADFEAVELSGEGRLGLLTHPALMAQLARPQKTHPINRGLFVRSKLLCQELSPPAGLVFPPLPETPTMGVTTREEVIDHAKPACAVCHDQLDPPGLAFENFDQVGRHRDMENGRPVDTSGKMISSGDLDGDFAKGEDLLKRVSTSQTVKECFAQQYFEFALSGDVARPVADEDACSLEGVRKDFTSSGDLRKLVVAVANSDSFRLRQSEGVAP